MEPSAERVAIFIDGGNFYRLIRENGLPAGARLSYPALVEFLLRDRPLVSKSYYIGIVRNYDQSAKSQKFVEDQQKFLSGLEAEGFTIGRGRIVYDHKIREKGVDVHIAIDLIVGALEDRYDTAILVSSDTDLLPAVKYVLSKGKKVEYVGFSARPSLGMTAECSMSILLLPEDIRRFSGQGKKEASAPEQA
jgi:uncharacterized LabA/DUF88 family protein